MAAKQESSHKLIGAQPSFAYEIFITAVTFFALVNMITFYLIPTSEVVNEVLLVVDTLFIMPIFVFDFMQTFYRSSHKLRYMWTRGWFDLLGSFPFFPFLRILRISRVLVAWRTLKKQTPAEQLAAARQHLAQSTFLGVLFLAVVALTIGSAAVVSVEASAPSANIKSGSDAVWWSIVTVATVGYGDFYPVTSAGRLIGIIVIVIGVSLFSVMTGFLSTTFLSRRTFHQGDEDIAQMRAEVAEIRRLLQAQLPNTPEQDE